MELRPGEMAEHGGGDRRGSTFSLLLGFLLFTLYKWFIQGIYKMECFLFINFQLDTQF